MIEVSTPKQGIRRQDMTPGNLYTFAEKMHPNFDGAVLLAIQGSVPPSDMRQPRPIRTIWLNKDTGPMQLHVCGQPEVLYVPYEGSVTIKNT